MKCPYCAEEIKDEAVKCKYCLSLITKESKKENNTVSKETVKVISWGFVIIIIFTFIVIIFGNNEDSIKNVATPSSSPQIYIPKENTWEYQNKEDKISGKSVYYATIEANEKLYFDFPYNGGVTASLVLRHNADSSNDAMLIVSKGQFTGTYNNESISVRFDSGSVEKYSFNEPSDGSSDVIFIGSTEKFISKVRKSKKIFIEATFYDQGNHTMIFNTEGIKF